VDNLESSRGRSCATVCGASVLTSWGSAPFMKSSLAPRLPDSRRGAFLLPVISERPPSIDLGARPFSSQFAQRRCGARPDLIGFELWDGPRGSRGAQASRPRCPRGAAGPRTRCPSVRGVARHSGFSLSVHLSTRGLCARLSKCRWENISRALAIANVSSMQSITRGGPSIKPDRVIR
jgi:hypothetical protein